jgi:hypothetical protein
MKKVHRKNLQATGSDNSGKPKKKLKREEADF